MPLTKAKIIVSRGGGPETIEVLFNPNEYAIEGGNQYAWQKTPGLSIPLAQFISGEASTLTMDLFFDTYDVRSDVRTHTKKIAGLLDVDSDLHAPPLCKFVWGSFSFQGLVERVTQRYTMFLETGIPVRAVTNVCFRAWQSIADQFKNIPRQSADRTKEKTLKMGEQLWMIAAHEYEDPGLWKQIARANQIDNPRLIAAGQRLIVPPLE
ncbi:MAG: CIS tube protein [Solirubrobacterales bacterium]